MKLDRAVCSAMGLNKRKYLLNSLLRLLIACAIVYFDALIDFIGHYLKRDRQIQRMGLKKGRHELVFRYI